MVAFGGRGGIAPTHSWPRHQMGVSGQRHAPAALCPGERTPDTPWTGGWVGPRAGLDTEVGGKNPLPLSGIEPRSPGRPVRSQTLYWLSYGWGDGFLKAIKIRSKPSFGCEVKPDVPCHKALRHVKNHMQVWKKCLQLKILTSFVHSSYLLPDKSQRALVDESGVYPSRHHHLTMVFQLISHGWWKKSRWWLRLRDIVSPPRYDQSISRSCRRDKRAVG
jgi:hypothetical protein